MRQELCTLGVQFCDLPASGSFVDLVAPYEHQVAGHPLTLFRSSRDKVLYKLVSRQELNFYLALKTNDRLSSLRRNIPASGGIYKFSNYSVTPIRSGHPLLENKEYVMDSSEGSIAIQLEDLLDGIENPVIGDFKLGKVLYCCCVSEEKRARMILRAKETTSSELGLRIGGMKMWNPCTNTYEIMTKNQVRVIKSDDLPGIFQEFFIIPGSERKIKRILLKVLVSLEDIRSAYLKSDAILHSSSLLVAYDRNMNENSKVVVKLIDFARGHPTGRKGMDSGGVLCGLDNMINYVRNVYNST